jgi:mono/diheme cytochrome c family protein
MPPWFVISLVGSLAILLTADVARGEHRDIRKLFATSCGFCHLDGGRKAGRGPQLMNSKRNDSFLRDRMTKGASGRMPAFGKTLSDQDMDEIIAYIRQLKPD